MNFVEQIQMASDLAKLASDLAKLTERVKALEGGKTDADAISDLENRVDVIESRGATSDDVLNLHGDLEKRVRALEKRIADLDKHTVGLMGALEDKMEMLHDRLMGRILTLEKKE